MTWLFMSIIVSCQNRYLFKISVLECLYSVNEFLYTKLPLNSFIPSVLWGCDKKGIWPVKTLTPTIPKPGWAI